MRDIKNITVIIPCYEPSEKNFVPYVSELLDAGIENIVIVDDGSGDKYRHVFERVCELSLDKVHFLDYAENKGKGYALKTAFAYCRDKFNENTVFVTADCDGQHIVEDVIRVGEFTKQNPKAFILGARDFSLPNVPKRSRTGNTKIRAMLKYFYGINASDTQTGLRGFSYALLDMLIDISGDRFEYETHQLIALSKEHIGIKEITIQTVYEDKADDVEKVSHFRTFTDSAKVVGVLFKKLEMYFLSSVLSSIVDIGVFALLFSVILNTESVALETLIATVVARVLSSIVNFSFNYKLVFNGSTKRSIYRYYILWSLQLCASYGFAVMWAHVTEVKILVSLLKAVSDLLLAVLSYQVQNKWVFANKKPPRFFFGPYANFARGLFNLFRRRYNTDGIPFQKEGCVYVCRHLNMHGCYTTIRSLPFDVHIMAYHVFFSFKDSYKQYSEITFAKNGRATFGSKIKAFYLSLFVPGLARSMKGIPVFRGSIESFATIKSASRHLKERECVIVFPDLNYKASADTDSDIYKGFLLLEKPYYRHYGKHLKFVPLYIDDSERKIYMHEPISFEDGDLRGQIDGVAQRIKQCIGERP